MLAFFRVVSYDENAHRIINNLRSGGRLFLTVKVYCACNYKNKYISNGFL